MSTRDYVAAKTGGLCHRSSVHPTAGLVCFDGLNRQAAVIGPDGSISYAVLNEPVEADIFPLAGKPISAEKASRILRDW